MLTLYLSVSWHPHLYYKCSSIPFFSLGVRCLHSCMSVVFYWHMQAHISFHYTYYFVCYNLQQHFSFQDFFTKPIQVLVQDFSLLLESSLFMCTADSVIKTWHLFAMRVLAVISISLLSQKRT